MNLKRTAVLVWAFLLATASIAGEEQRTRVEIEIDDDESSHQSFRFDSEDAGFDLDDLAVGETRTLTGKDGNTAMVTRTEDGLEIEVNGKTIDLSGLHEYGASHGDHKVKHEKKIKMISAGDGEAVTIISDKIIDETTRRQIREVLRSSGQDGKVVFIDGSELTAAGAHEVHSRQEVRVIKIKEEAKN